VSRSDNISFHREAEFRPTRVSDGSGSSRSVAKVWCATSRSCAHPATARACPDRRNRFGLLNSDLACQTFAVAGLEALDRYRARAVCSAPNLLRNVGTRPSFAPKAQTRRSSLRHESRVRGNHICRGIKTTYRNDMSITNLKQPRLATCR